MMRANMGDKERVIRVLVGLLVAFGGYKVGGTFGIVLDVVAALAVLTGAMGHCHVYHALGVNTCPMKKQ
jgi:hypothetical protein